MTISDPVFVSTQHAATTRWVSRFFAAPESIILAAVLLLLGAILAYSPAIGGGFIWDDNYLVWNNPINNSPDGLHKIWFSLENFDYWPVAASTFWIEWQWWGPNPMPYHVQNILLHALNALLFWLILRRINMPGAWLAAMLFAVHPVTAASVVWISELKNTLSTFLALLAVLTYLHTEKITRWWGILPSLTLFTMAMLSKSSLVGLPVFLPAYAWWKTGRIDKRDLLKAAPFFAVAAVTAGIAVWFHHFSPARHDICMETPTNFAARVAGAGWAIWFYFYKTLLPVNLIMIYPHWKVNWLNPLSYVPSLTLLALALACWKYRHAWGRTCLVALVCFTALVFPILGFVNMSFMMHSLVADHFQYQGMMVTLAALVWGGWIGFHRLRRPIDRIAALSALTVVMLSLAILTAQRSAILSNHIPLWRDTIARNPNAWMAYYHLGTELAMQGEKMAAAGQAPQATPVFQEAADVLARGGELQPGYPYMFSNLAIAYLRLNRPDDAIKAQLHVVELLDRDSMSRHTLADMLQQAGKTDDAIKYYRQSVEVSEGKNLASRLRLAILLMNKGDADSCKQASEHLQAILVLEPNSLDTLLALAGLNFRQQRFDDARQWALKAVEKYPQAPAARKAYADTLIRLNRISEAIDQYIPLANAGINDPAIYITLANLLLQRNQSGDLPNAVNALQTALRLNVNDPVAWNTLGMVMETAGQLDQAINAYQRALVLQNNSQPIRDNLARAITKKQRQTPPPPAQ